MPKKNWNSIISYTKHSNNKFVFQRITKKNHLKMPKIVKIPSIESYKLEKKWNISNNPVSPRNNKTQKTAISEH